MPNPKSKSENQKDIQAWLRRYLEAEYSAGRVLAGGTLLLGLGVLFFNFFIIYFVIWLVADLPQSALLLLSLLGLAALFYGHTRLEHIAARWATDPMQPEWVRLLFKISPAILFLGPRLLTYTWRTYLRIETYQTGFDIEGCAAVLEELLANYRRVDFPALQAGLPSLDLAALLPQLQQIQGVQFITNLQPPGVLLTDSLRQELLSLGRERNGTADERR